MEDGSLKGGRAETQRVSLPN